jgi:hypothetical protein
MGQALNHSPIFRSFHFRRCTCEAWGLGIGEYTMDRTSRFLVLLHLVTWSETTTATFAHMVFRLIPSQMVKLD